jgi:hypothetical protein
MLQIFLVFLISFKVYSQSIPFATIQDQNEMVTRYENIILQSASTKEALTLNEISTLLELVSNNVVASLGSISLYDPPQNDQPVGEIGYCYGRAMAAHLMARKFGLSERSISKIFAAGDMQNGSIRWRFHVATIVPGVDGNLYAIDPIMPDLIRRYNRELGTQFDPAKALTPVEWINIVEHFYANEDVVTARSPELLDNPNFNGVVKFYMTSTRAIMVDMRVIPANIAVENGKRIIEVLFNPSLYGGFRPVYHKGELLYYEVVNEQTLDELFMTYDEPLIDQFDFFKLDIDIYFIKDDIVRETGRSYLYNGKQPGELEFQHYSQGYFPMLIKSIEEMGTLL